MPALEHMFQDDFTENNYFKFVEQLGQNNIQLSQTNQMENKKTMPLSSAKKIMLRAQFRRNRAAVDFEQTGGDVSKLLLPKHHKETN